MDVVAETGREGGGGDEGGDEGGGGEGGGGYCGPQLCWSVRKCCDLRCSLWMWGGWGDFVFRAQALPVTWKKNRLSCLFQTEPLGTGC